MPLTKEDIQRVLTILEDLLSEVEMPEEEEVEDLVNVQSAVDTLKSPLFTALVDIRNDYEKTVEESQQWNEVAEVRFTEQPELLPQFCQRYGIPGSPENGLSSARGESPSSAADELLEEALSPSSISSEMEGPGLELRSTLAGGLSLSQQESATSLASDTESVDSVFTRVARKPTHSESSTDGSSAPPTAGGRGRHGSGFSLFGGGARKKSSGGRKGGGVSLAHLAHSTSASGAGVKGIPLSGPEPVLVPRGERSASESSLSSMSSESSQHVQSSLLSRHKAPTKQSKASGGGVREEGAGEGEGGNHPKDILFFMRDKKSQTEIREVLHGSFGRSPREIRLTQPEQEAGLGVELEGLNDTGVYVSELAEGGKDEVLLQVGDQILEVNGQSVENMADFEVEHLLKRVGSGEEVALVVQYNPAEFFEKQKHDFYQDASAKVTSTGMGSLPDNGGSHETQSSVALPESQPSSSDS